MTAALARKILRYLGAEDAKELTIPNGLWPEEGPYKLGTVLDRIIHFKTLGQDLMSLDFPGKPDLVTLYSDENLRYADRIFLRLADYRESVERLANDDLLVGRYLLRQAATLMGKTENTGKPKTYEEEIPHNDLRRTVYELIWDSWNVVYGLERCGRIHIEPQPFECHEDLFGGHTKTYDGITTWNELIDGYMAQWNFASSNPCRLDVEGSDIYSMLLSAKRTDGKQGILGLALPFRTISAMFVVVRKQIAEALAERDSQAIQTGS